MLVSNAIRDLKSYGKGKMSLADVKMIIFMRFLGNYVLNVQSKIVSVSFGHMLRKIVEKMRSRV